MSRTSLLLVAGLVAACAGGVDDRPGEEVPQEQPPKFIQPAPPDPPVEVVAELCDGLDNDQDGIVDEQCACTAGQSQACYPLATAPAAGCEHGTQTCDSDGEFGRWGPCVGAKIPDAGKTTCEAPCEALVTNPTHAVLDAFVVAYPSSSMPQNYAEVVAFQPQVPGTNLIQASANVGGELIDCSNGGVTVTNVSAGRDLARTAAENAVPANATTVSTLELAPELNGSGCAGVGWAWGSILYQLPDLSVGEIVFLYVGADHGSQDAEAFFVSEMPAQVCSGQGGQDDQSGQMD